MNRRKLLEYWWVLPVGATFGAMAYMARYAYTITFGKQKAGIPQYIPSPAVRISAVDALTEDYQSLNFTYAQTPCVAMRIPKVTASSIKVGNGDWVAFSRVCTHLGCSVVPERDIETVAFSYHYRPENPILGCPCHFSVFDPLQEGESVFGKALYPLPRVQLQVRGNSVYALGIEKPATNLTTRGKQGVSPQGVC